MDEVLKLALEGPLPTALPDAVDVLTAVPTGELAANFPRHSNTCLRKPRLMDLTRGFLLRCNWKIQDSQLIANFAEVHAPDLPTTHSRRGQRPVQSRGGCGRRGESQAYQPRWSCDHVLALGVAYAVRFNLISMPANRLNDFAQRDGGAGRASSLETCGFADGEAVASSFARSA